MTQYLDQVRNLDIPDGETAVFVEKALAPQTDVRIGKDAHVRHFRLLQEASHTMNVRVDEGGSYELVTVRLGSGDLRISADLAGRKASCSSDIVYVLSGDDVGLIETDFRHNADETASAQLIKGAVSGTAKLSFEGGIYIPSGRKAIDGAQQHRALLLSPRGEIKVVPKLEIYADDVKCAHGSAIGTLNERQLFYLRTRGIDEALAREILTAAFLFEVLEKIDQEDVREEFKTLITRRMASHV